MKQDNRVNGGQGVAAAQGFLALPGGAFSIARFADEADSLERAAAVSRSGLAHVAGRDLGAAILIGPIAAREVAFLHTDSTTPAPPLLATT